MLTPNLPFRSARTIPGASRIAGRGALLRSLRLLLRRLERYGEHRAATPDERRWAIRLLDCLNLGFTEAIAAPGARASLQHIDHRRICTSKRRPRHTGVTRVGHRREHIT